MTFSSDLSVNTHSLCCLIAMKPDFLAIRPGLFPVILGKGPWPKLGKNDCFNIKLGEINDIEHNKGYKIYPQNQVILDCNLSSIPLKHKCLSLILIQVIVSHKW